MSCNCNQNRIQSAVITPTLALGSTSSPYFVQVQILQRLCFACCVDATPVFNPLFSVKSVAQVASDSYVATLHVEGVISYVPCNGNCCCTKQQPLSQDFTIPISATSAPTITIAQGACVNAIAASACQSCSKNFVSETPLTITIA